MSVTAQQLISDCLFLCRILPMQASILPITTCKEFLARHLQCITSECCHCGTSQLADILIGCAAALLISKLFQINQRINTGCEMNRPCTLKTSSSSNEILPSCTDCGSGAAAKPQPSCTFSVGPTHAHLPHELFKQRCLCAKMWMAWGAISTKACSQPFSGSLIMHCNKSTDAHWAC